MGSSLDQDALRRLPTTLRYSEARSLINERRFRDLLAQRLIVRLNRGLYRKADAAGDEELIEIAAQRPRATLCLRTALARHDLIDDIPAELDIALPRGTRAADTTAPVAWHQFDPETFDIGRDTRPRRRDDHRDLLTAPVIDGVKTTQFVGWLGGPAPGSCWRSG